MTMVLTRFMGTLLFKIEPGDPLVPALSVTLLAAVTARHRMSY
jgi:hypothetical protein